MEKIYQQICNIAAKHQAKKVVLFGSRARGDHHPTSDIDLAVWGMPKTQQVPFAIDLEEQIDTLLKFDVVHIVPQLKKDFLDNIKKDGVTLYEQSET